MRAEYFLESYIEHWTDVFNKYLAEGKVSPKRSETWNLVYEDVMKRTADDHFLKFAKRRMEFDREESMDFLNIDYMLFNKKEYDLVQPNERGPFTIPKVCVEQTHHTERHKILYHMWKILTVRSPINVLICYQENEPRVREVIQRMTKTINDGSLMQKHYELIVILGNDDVDINDGFDEFFTLLEWKKNGFRERSDMDWG